MSFVNVVHAPESGGLHREIYLGDEDNKSDMPADFIMHFAVLPFHCVQHSQYRSTLWRLARSVGMGKKGHKW